VRINLVGDLHEDRRLDEITTPNQIYAWFLHKAFVESDVDVRLIPVSKLLEGMTPKADHTIVILSASSYVLKNWRHTQKLRASTKGKLACYMNIDKLKRSRCFDYCFTQIGPVIHQPEKYICVGWGVDPDYSYPEQSEKAVFLDSKSLNPYHMKKGEKTYSTYDNVLSTLNMKVYNPVAIYSESKRLPYSDYQAILRKCHYFLCTQFGDGGLNRLEAAACGALLVVPAKLYRKRTMSLLNHRVWNTEEELISILQEDVDIEANRQRALEHTWDKVAKRILGVLTS